MQCAFVLTFLLFSVRVVCGQNENSIDSLKALLETVKGPDRFEILYDLAFEYIAKSDFNASLEYATEAQQLAYGYGDSTKIVKAGRVKGQILRRLDRSRDAIQEFRQILLVAKRNKLIDEYKYILNGLAVTHTFQAEYDQALKYHFESLILRQNENEKEEIVVTLNNIGLVYFKLKNYENALQYYNQALAIVNEQTDNRYKDKILINIGLCYNQLRRFSEALEFIDNGLAVCYPNCSNIITIEGEFGLGVSLFGLKEYDKSEGHFLKSLSLSDSTQNKRFQLENLVYLSRIATILRSFAKAEEILKKSESIALNTEYNLLLIEIYKCYSDLYNETKAFEQAANYQNRYIHLKDSIYNEQLIENIAQIQTDFAERENIATIAANKVVIKQQRDLNFAVAIIAMMAGLLILVLQRSNRTIKKVNAQLSEAKEVIQEQNVLLEGKNKYLDREVEAKTIDLERANQSLKQVNDELDNFIYKTSHDIRGPLASLKGMCNVALMDVKDPVALDYLRKLDHTAERLNTILTRLLIINQINNSKLTISRIDFDGIVKDVLMLEKKKGLPQKLQIRQRIERNQTIRSDKELIRIVMENLIDNAIKFYNDSERVDSFVEIHIVPAAEGHVRIRVIDNGIGISESNPGKLFRMFFRASERSETGGIGLYIVKTATSKLGGKVGLLTTPEGFTEFYVDFPPSPPSPEDGPDKPAIF